METLSQAVDHLQDSLSFPHANIKADTNICDSLHIAISLQPKAEWPHGIFQNSPFVQIMIFPLTRHEKDCKGLYKVETISQDYKLPRMRAKNKGTLEAIVKHVEKYLGSLPALV